MSLTLRLGLRLPSGRLVHEALAASTGDGLATVVRCEPSLIRWFSYDEISRLDLRYDVGDADCGKCARARTLERQEAAP